MYENPSLSVCLKDIQAEIDAHNDIYKSVDGNKSKMVKALGSSEEAVFLQNRLDDMNQRWSDLKAKSASIRSAELHVRLNNMKLFCLFCGVYGCTAEIDVAAVLLLSTLERKIILVAHECGGSSSRSLPHFFNQPVNCIWGFIGANA